MSDLQSLCIEAIIEKRIPILTSNMSGMLLDDIEKYFEKHYCQKHTEIPTKKEDCDICNYIEEKEERLTIAINSCHCDYHENLWDDFQAEQDFLDINNDLF